jgi:beta-lactamase superfamily II metal-dependent hydrolase
MPAWIERLLIIAAFAFAFELGNAKINVPPSNSTVTVKAFNGVVPNPNNTGPAASFVFPVLPGTESLDADLLAFLVENPAKQIRVMFDIGLRKDVQNLVPSLAALFSEGAFKLDVEDDIPTQLKKGNISLESIDAVIWSHSHFDHIGTYKPQFLMFVSVSDPLS